MRISVTVEKRRFDFHDLTEDEAKILRTMVNLNDQALMKVLQNDDLYWKTDELDIKEAVKIAMKVRDQIFKAVDRSEEIQ